MKVKRGIFPVMKNKSQFSGKQEVIVYINTDLGQTKHPKPVAVSPDAGSPQVHPWGCSCGILSCSWGRAEGPAGVGTAQRAQGGTLCPPGHQGLGLGVSGISFLGYFPLSKQGAHPRLQWVAGRGFSSALRKVQTWGEIAVLINALTAGSA